MTSTETLVPDLHFPEGLRWHDGQLWFSDIFGGEVVRVGASGPEIVARVPGPSGLGWLPDGSTVVATFERNVLRDRCRRNHERARRSARSFAVPCERHGGRRGGPGVRR